MSTQIPEQVRRWYRKIGAKGGQAGKGTPLRKRLMRDAANARWSKHRAVQAAQKPRRIVRKLVPKARRPQPQAEPLPAIGFK